MRLSLVYFHMKAYLLTACILIALVVYIWRDVALYLTTSLYNKEIINSVLIDHELLSLYEVSLQQPQEITRIQHQSWKTKALPPRFSKWRSTWSTCLINWTQHLWTDKQNRQLVTRYFPWFLRRYNQYSWEIYRADIVRYMYLYIYGGLYTDLDCSCIRSPEALLYNKTIVFGAMEANEEDGTLKEGLVENHFIYSKPRHPFWMEVLAVATQVPNIRVEYATGPQLIMQVLRLWRHREELFMPGGVARKSDIHIYPPKFFNPFSWSVPDSDSPCVRENAMTESQVIACQEYYTRHGAYVIHHHTDVWGAGSAT